MEREIHIKTIFFRRIWPVLAALLLIINTTVVKKLIRIYLDKDRISVNYKSPEKVSNIAVRDCTVYERHHGQAELLLFSGFAADHNTDNFIFFSSVILLVLACFISSPEARQPLLPAHPLTDGLPVYLHLHKIQV